MKAQNFLQRHPVFRHEEFKTFLKARGALSKRTQESLLDYYTRAGRILRVHRGLYASVPPGVDVKTISVDPYLVAAKSAPDAVLAYHTALEFHGKAHSVFERFYYLSAHAARPIQFRSHSFLRVPFPKALGVKQRHFGVIESERAGEKVYVASLERTLVDVLDRPDLGGGWEEVWRSLESVEFFDLNQVVDYALLLNNATTIAKVGFYLEQHREVLSVAENHLARLHKRQPRSPHYVSRQKGSPARFVPSWNILVPEEILQKSWQEVS